MKRHHRHFPARYLLMDARAFEDIDAAQIFDTADTIKEAKQRAKPFGRLSEFEVAVVDSKTDDVLWELYAGRRQNCLKTSKRLPPGHYHYSQQNTADV